MVYKEPIFRNFINLVGILEIVRPDKYVQNTVGPANYCFKHITLSNKLLSSKIPSPHLLLIIYTC